VNRPEIPEAVSVESDHHGRIRLFCVVRRLELSWRNIAERLEQAAIVEPIDPLQRGELDGLAALPRPATVDLGFEERVDGFGEGVVVGVALAADRSFDARFGEALGVANR
jgi:hypothetical protein